jgi:hypothetical protein
LPYSQHIAEDEDHELQKSRLSTGDEGMRMLFLIAHCDLRSHGPNSSLTLCAREL